MAYQMTEEHKAKLQAARLLKKEQQDISGETRTRSNPVERSLADPTSLRKAVDAKCYLCIYDEHGTGSWKDQVRQCSVGDACPLFKCRPQ